MTKLKKIRMTVGLTQQQLADETGLKLTSIQKLESGANNINKAWAITVYTLAKALNCSVGDLLEEEGGSAGD